ncbi:MAG: O-antigen ligase family protein [Planctomycetaceae bacterium]|nr:O-antigen ligase family protein [Planctomycetaceae bacterium]
MSTLLQRLLIAIAILEIPLQIDTYLFYHEWDAEFGALGGINVSMTTLALIALYGLWLVETALTSRQLPRRITWGVPLLLYIGVVSLSAVVAEKWILTFFEVTLLVQAYLLFFYVANRVTTKGDVTFLIGLFAVSLAVQGFIIGGTFRLGGPREIGLGPMAISISPEGRPCGTISSPVLAGSFLALLFMPVGCLVTVPVRRRLQVLGFLGATLGALGIVLTQTRGAIITMTVASLIFSAGMLVRGWLPRWTPVAALVIGAVISVPLLMVFQNRVQDGDGGSAEARVHHYGIGMHLISERPLLGYGAGNCHLAAQNIASSSPYRAEWFYTIHSKYLLVCVETGLLGLGAFTLFLLTTLWQGWRVWRLGDRVLSPFALAIAAGIAGQLIHMGVDVFNSRQLIQTLWCCAGIIAGIEHILTSAARPHITHNTLRSDYVTGHAA